MKVSIDLDSVIFDIEPLYKKAFKIVGEKFKRPISWNLYESCGERVAPVLLDLFGNDVLYQMPLLDKKIPQILNDLMGRDDVELFFVTERRKKQPDKTYKQLRNAGINCSLAQVYDMPGFKPDILQTIAPDVHYDDSPNVILGCIERRIPVAMISHAKTPYNHHLRQYIEYYKSLRSALRAEGLYTPAK